MLDKEWQWQYQKWLFQEGYAENLRDRFWDRFISTHSSLYSIYSKCFISFFTTCNPTPHAPSRVSMMLHESIRVTSWSGVATWLSGRTSNGSWVLRMVRKSHATLTLENKQNKKVSCLLAEKKEDEFSTRIFNKQNCCAAPSIEAMPNFPEKMCKNITKVAPVTRLEIGFLICYLFHFNRGHEIYDTTPPK